MNERDNRAKAGSRQEHQDTNPLDSPFKQPPHLASICDTARNGYGAKGRYTDPAGSWRLYIVDARAEVLSASTLKKGEGFSE